MGKKIQKIIQINIVPFAIFLVASFSFLFIYTALASDITPNGVIALANSAREKEGLAPLVSNAKLASAAQAKAEDMLKHDYFAHTSPQGFDPWHWIKQAGYSYTYAGENLAINYSSVKDQQTAWMNSETHRANIMNVHYKEIGVAVVEGKIDGETSLITVELFGTPLQAVADQSRAVPPVEQKSSVSEALPEVKGTEIAETPVIVSLPASQQASEALPTRWSKLFSWMQGTYWQTLENATVQRWQRIEELVQKVNWLEEAEITVFALLLVTLILGPLVFFFSIIELLVHQIRRNSFNKANILDVSPFPQMTTNALHQNMRQKVELIQDIKAL